VQTLVLERIFICVLVYVSVFTAFLTQKQQIPSIGMLQKAKWPPKCQIMRQQGNDYLKFRAYQAAHSVIALTNHIFKPLNTKTSHVDNNRNR